MKEKIIPIVGVITILLIAFYIYNYEQNNENGEILLTTEYISDVRNIELELETYNVKITADDTSEKQIKIDYNQEEDDQLKIVNDNGILVIKEKQKSYFFNFVKPSHDIQLFVPHSMIDEIKIDVLNGDVEINSNIDKIAVDVVNGNVLINSIVKDLVVEGVNSDINIGVKNNINANLDSVNGNLNMFFASDLNYEIEISTINGTITDEILGLKEKNIMDTKKINKGKDGSKIKFNTINGDTRIKYID